MSKMRLSTENVHVARQSDEVNEVRMLKHGKESGEN